MRDRIAALSRPPEFACRLVLEDPHAPGEPAAEAGGAASGGGGQEPALLDSCLGWQFWRFELQLQLGAHQRPVDYAIQASGPARQLCQAKSHSLTALCGEHPVFTHRISSLSLPPPPHVQWGAGKGSCTLRHRFWLPAAGQNFHAASWEGWAG